MRIHQITEAPRRTATIAFGRMNPPTIGHAKVVEVVKSQGGDPYIFLSQSQKPKTDPLSFEQKLGFAKAFFPGVSVGDPEVRTIFDALIKVYNMGYTDLVYVAGSDRVNQFTDLINKYNGQEDQYTFDSIQVVSAGERDPDAEGAEGMSASKMRAAAAAGEFEAFKSGTPNPDMAQSMYDAVRNGMGIKDQEPVPEADAVNKRSMSGDTQSFRYTTTGGRLPTSNTSKPNDITKRFKQVDMPDEPYEFDFDSLDTAKLKKTVARLIDGLGNDKNKQVVQAYFGIGKFEKSYTLDQIATAMGVTREVIRQRLAKVLRQLRHPDLRAFMDDVPIEEVELDEMAKKVLGEPGAYIIKQGKTEYKISPRLNRNDRPSGEWQIFMKDRDDWGWDRTVGSKRDAIDWIKTQKEDIEEADGMMESLDRIIQVTGTLRRLNEVKPLNENVKNKLKSVLESWSAKYEAKLNLPDLETGDELMVGKFKNRKATIKDFTKDKHNQPVAVTDKGEQQIFKGRVKKLMPTEESASWIKEIVNTQSRVNEADTLTLPSIIDDTVVTLGKLFAKNNYEIRIVGGAVRDVALGRTPKDIDLATDATPTEMQSMFDSAGIRHIPTGIEHGTITAVIDSEPYEITTLRADKTTDGRHAEVEFVRSWEEDAKRRDLTYNAMSLDMEGNVHDYFGGMDDLQDKVSKFVGDPQARIQEDYLRILRHFRFQSKLDTPTFDKETIDAIAKNAKGLTQISAERIWQEMSKLLVSPGMADAISWIGKTGVAKYIGLDVTGTPKQFDNPIIALANIISDASLGSKWKLSNSDKELLTFLIKNKLTKIDQNQAEDLVAGGIPDAYIQALATLQNVNLQPVSVPEFPVTGKDLIALGIKSGPNMGIHLAQLKQIWQQSRFKASKEDLLKNLADVVEGKSPHKKGTTKYNKHMAAMHAGMNEEAQDIAEDGIIVKGVNTTPDVGPNEIKVQASKMGFKVDKGGRPPLLHTKAAKNSDPNTLFNLGLTESVDYVKPQFDVEWEEANRYPYLEKLGQAGWEELAGAGKVITVNTNSVKNIENTGADGSEALDDLEPEKVARLKQAMDAGTIEMPIVVKQSDGSYSLVAGNTRLIGLITTYGKAKVWLVDASNLAEGQLTERGSIGVPLSNGIIVGIAPHRELKIKKSTPGKLSYNENVEVDISGNAEKGYVLSKIVVPKELRGTGVGSKIMQDLINKADMEGAIIALTPDTAFGGSKGRLIQFYKSFGFVPNKGRNKDFRYRETMIRYPKT